MNKASTSARNSLRNKIAGFALLIPATALFYTLNKPIGDLPPLGKLLDPYKGCMANAEATRIAQHKILNIPGVKKEVIVTFDDQLTPHIQAQNEHDLFVAQGYLHAYYRLWQMDMQVRAAAGQLSEVAGIKALAYDKRQRRKGMIYAAEQSLAAAEKDERSKLMMDAYTKGVNAYIQQLNYRQLAVEYKLMNFVPEVWSNLKTCLILKLMADDLTGLSDDIAHSYLVALIGRTQFDYLFPNRINGSTPVIPTNSPHIPASLAIPQSPADSIAFPHYTMADFTEAGESGKGSNNWAVAGSRTNSGAPILCNDPHLSLNLPALWYKVQLQCPGMNVYGVSLPGTPCVVIGFNEQIAWGLTNNYRDVKDYYEIERLSDKSNQYRVSKGIFSFNKRAEVIKIKNQTSITDTVLYTIHGPILYDSMNQDNSRMRKMIAVRWMGHNGSNELLAINLLAKAANYDAYKNAISHFDCPAQNMLYADKKGNIALWGQGKFVNKWKHQGNFLMNGNDSATLWGSYIPFEENPHIFNPSSGYLASANQCVTDTSYPYWYNGSFTEWRAWRINQILSKGSKISIAEMFALQNDNYSVLASRALPIMLANTSDKTDPCVEELRKWDYRLEANNKAATSFQIWWYHLHRDIWKDDLPSVPGHLQPSSERTVELMEKDTTLAYYDNLCTKDVRENLRGIIAKSYIETKDSLRRLLKINSGQWYAVKNTSLKHLAKLEPFSINGLVTGGWGNTVNAMKGNHGPSWRMVVEMGNDIVAWGIYPGGQSGNPGSKYYANYASDWANGQYHPLYFTTNNKPLPANKTISKWTIKGK